MDDLAAQLESLAAAWTDELARTLRERCAWAHLGTIDFARNRGTGTLGGYIDRRAIIPAPGASPIDALEAWRRTPEGKVHERLVAQANLALLQRIKPAAREAPIGDWLAHLPPSGHVALLGAAKDLVAVARLARTVPGGERLHACPVDAGVRAGTLAAVTAPGLACSIVALISIARAADALHVVSVIDVKPRTLTGAERTDLLV